MKVGEDYILFMGYSEEDDFYYLLGEQTAIYAIHGDDIVKYTYDGNFADIQTDYLENKQVQSFIQSFDEYDQFQVFDKKLFEKRLKESME
ncbi:hypothetical protein [Alkalihalobacillus pseudalcaliphilus]|uniref:hypothetical protein n=1 Tax=Alkalihalobacillus pseudalcaliphilus TaxID=79884 RepID=UPI00064D7473|nr:hypothetical protein [Alkalihalobacillus pseudalcaliphilus]KMK75798.1 hypothetical protein AB990_11050 [Alkalihalobacillus pseudalcaliphilus]